MHPLERQKPPPPQHPPQPRLQHDPPPAPPHQGVDEAHQRHRPPRPRPVCPTADRRIPPGGVGFSPSMSTPPRGERRSRPLSRVSGTSPGDCVGTWPEPVACVSRPAAQVSDGRPERPAQWVTRTPQRVDGPAVISSPSSTTIRQLPPWVPGSLRRVQRVAGPPLQGIPHPPRGDAEKVGIGGRAVLPQCQLHPPGVPCLGDEPLSPGPPGPGLEATSRFSHRPEASANIPTDASSGLSGSLRSMGPRGHQCR